MYLTSVMHEYDEFMTPYPTSERLRLKGIDKIIMMSSSIELTGPGKLIKSE